MARRCNVGRLFPLRRKWQSSSHYVRWFFGGQRPDYLTAKPNPIALNGAQTGMTTITWTAPSSVQYVEVRVGSPTGALFALGGPNGSSQTGSWVTDGEMFFLQNVTNGLALTSDNTLAILIIHAI